MVRDDLEDATWDLDDRPKLRDRFNLWPQADTQPKRVDNHYPLILVFSIFHYL